MPSAPPYDATGITPASSFVRRPDGVCAIAYQGKGAAAAIIEEKSRSGATPERTRDASGQAIG
ncbi:hypothetical protein PSAC2689_230079 [Paraburkholderia sacchari]